MAFLLIVRQFVLTISSKWVIKWLSEYFCELIMSNHYKQYFFFIQMYVLHVFLRKDKIMYIFWKWPTYVRIIYLYRAISWLSSPIEWYHNYLVILIYIIIIYSCRVISQLSSHFDLCHNYLVLIYIIII